jgi:DNA-binding SARP family transcriptional activator
MMIDVKVLGPTVVAGDSGRLVASELGGNKSRQLLEMLALDLGNPLSKDLIAERLWDGRPPVSYLATVESYVCVLRRSLGLMAGRRGPLATSSHGYLLDPEQVRVDVDEVRTRLRAGGADVLVALDQVSGELLADEPYVSWANQAREDFSELLAESCVRAALEANDRGDFEVAVRLAREATRHSYLSEPAAGELMRALIGTGERTQALHVYETLRRGMAEDLAIMPDEAIQAMYLRILRDDGGSTTRPSGSDEISTLLHLLRRALEADPVQLVSPLRMREVGLLLMARAG